MRKGFNTQTDMYRHTTTAQPQPACTSRSARGQGASSLLVVCSSEGACRRDSNERTMQPTRRQSHAPSLAKTRQAQALPWVGERASVRVSVSSDECVNYSSQCIHSQMSVPRQPSKETRLRRREGAAQTTTSNSLFHITIVNFRTVFLLHIIVLTATDHAFIIQLLYQWRYLVAQWLSHNTCT